MKRIFAIILLLTILIGCQYPQEVEVGVPVVESATHTYEDDSADQDFVLTKPAGTQQGDLLVALVSKDHGIGDWTAPEGWTEGIAKFSNSSIVHLAVYWKEAGASEPATYTFTYSFVGGSVFAGGILRISGADTGTPFHQTDTRTNNGTTHLCPDVTTTLDNCLILRLITADDDNYTDDGSPAGHTVLWVDDSALGSGITSGVAYESQELAGSPGTASFTGFTASEEGCGATVAIAPEQTIKRGQQIAILP